MNRQYAVAAAVAVLVLAALIYAFWPGAEAPPERDTPEVADAGSDEAKRKVTRFTEAEVKAEEGWLPLEEDPAIPVVTKTCKWIVTDERRNVPQWVMLDNLRDRGQMFVEDDIRCLTAAGVTPAILDFAERYQDQNKLQGRVGRPPGQ